MKKTVLLPMFILMFAILASPCYAYQYWVCLDRDLKWDSNNIPLHASSVSFAGAEWQAALSQAIDRWNVNPSNFRYNLSFGDTNVNRGNGENEVWFTNDASALNGSPAIAYYYWDCIDYWIFGKTVKLTEIDVLFSAGESYTPYLTNKNDLWEYGGASRPFQNTAIHELGHGVGLAHTNYTYNVMGQDWTHIHVNGSNPRAYVGEDTSNGAVHLYGLNGANIEDVSVTHWKYSGASGEYSTHERTKLYDMAGVELPSDVIAGEKYYRVKKGQKVQAEFTYENNGKNTQTVKTGFYISTNSLITTLDTRIGGVTKTLARDFVDTNKDTVTIPSNLTAGKTYWLGVIVDEDNTLTEVTKINNATYIPIKIQSVKKPFGVIDKGIKPK